MAVEYHIHLGNLTGEIVKAIEERNWEQVVRSAALLYRGARSSGNVVLAEAADTTIAGTLLILEHSIFEQCCTSLAKVMIASLTNGGAVS